MRLIFSLVLIASLTALVACSSKQPAPEVVSGIQFPRVSGETLKGEVMVLPDDLKGRPAILIVGYVQKAQFDIDRWMLGILQAKLDVPVVEVPTIEGLIPELASRFIDSGMRGGIPKDDWSAVVPIYRDASRIVEVLGKENEKNAQVVLLDSQGKIAWFHNEGYSPRLVLQLKDTISQMESSRAFAQRSF